MSDDQSKGYRLEIPEDVLDEALEVVQKPRRPAGEEAEVTVEIEDDGSSDENRHAPAEVSNELMEKLQAAEEAAAAAKDRMLRIAADADNVRKRALKEKQEAIKFGNESLVRDLLPVVDNLERTIKHMPAGIEDETYKALAEGVRMILLQFSETLRRHNVDGFDSVGQAFDPAKHEALSSKATATVDPGTILGEMHKGYLLNGRLLRPALVEVACAPKPEDQEPGGEENAANEGQAVDEECVEALEEKAKEKEDTEDTDAIEETDETED